MLARWDQFDSRRFAREGWRRGPLLVRGWLAPRALDRTALLAAAGSESVASRLVTGTRENADWQVEYGPFTRNDIPESSGRNWTLLIQDLDKIIPQVHEILDSFRFLPGWLVDDVMVSQAGPGGSVGPHVDAYDVFLVQAAGRRRWQLAELSEADNLEPDPRFELAVLPDFEPQVEIEVEPGDVLYLPPGIAHHGVALEACQTWSVGLRAPSAAELIADRAARLAEDEAALPRLDPPTLDPARPEHLDPALLRRARELLARAAALDESDLARFVGEAVTGYRLWEPGEAPSPGAADPGTPDPGTSWMLRPGTRTAWHESGWLFVNGQALACSPQQAESLCRTRRFEPADPEAMELLDALRDLDAVESANLD